MSEIDYNELSGEIIAAAIEVHKGLGPGLLESVYHFCLIDELKRRSINYKTQFKLPLHYKGKDLNKDFIIDLLIEDKIVVEIKAVEVILPVHEMQMVTFLKLSNMKLGLLINFNVPVLVKGIRRRINGTL
jgi:GxxExxY protein